MTERQQLAFLLRATAQDHSASDSASHSNSSSDDEAVPPAPKRMKPRTQCPKISSRSTTGEEDSSARRPPGRPRKTSPKATVEEDDAHAKAVSRTARNDRPTLKTTDKRLHIKTSSPSHQEDSIALEKASTVKPSPSSTSDVSHVSVFDAHESQEEFWSAHCALCSQHTTPFSLLPETLFLCPACDAKYPTQRALGLV